MKREIKFRAWHKGMNKMLSENEWHHYGPKMVKSSLQSYDHEIMQFTGLHDKNGKEIYEGDIVDNHRDALPIEFRGGSFGTWNGKDFMTYSTSWKIIGNIYENPELLTHKPETP